MGFKVSRYLRCYARVPKEFAWHKDIFPLQISYHEKEKFDFEAIEFESFPSFQHSRSCMLRNADEVFFYARHRQDKIAYLSLNKTDGYISQLWVSANYRRQGIGTALLAAAFHEGYSRLSALNIDAENHIAQAFLEKNSFYNSLNQYEMHLKLRPT
jgi:ribosomal protein S18 acetylase RimI-like enzyme